jgi:4-amino-4-deoxy-L-arabinose transferase-like glycosyltransferase
MARSGDWTTPRLWGVPWFEKPALLYWMTAAGFRFGLDNDLAPRLPVALLSVGFLFFFWYRLRQVLDEQIAGYATAMLATSAGWLAYSHVAVTDLPVAACFSAAVLLGLPGNREHAEPRRIAAAILLGFAVLAKSIPPLILFCPVLVLDRVNWRRWLISWPMVAFLLTALPWHIAATLSNGWDLPYTLFIEQQFGRFLKPTLMHGQPWWFYLPVFVALLFPWFPLLFTALRDAKHDLRLRTLAAIIALGMVFFSAAVNKLFGYVLPLLPATCILMANGLSRSKHSERWLIAPIAALGILPVIAAVAPDVAARGLKSIPIPWMQGALGLAVAGIVGAVAALGLRSRTFTLAALLAAGGFLFLEIQLVPALDPNVSARSFWRSSHPNCAPVLPRGMLYSLYYYAERKLPDCDIVDKNAGPALSHAEERQ